MAEIGRVGFVQTRSFLLACALQAGSPGQGLMGVLSGVTWTLGWTQSELKTDSNRLRMAGSFTIIPHSRLSSSDTQKKFSEPMKAFAFDVP
jgi:hypothetical protein